MDSKNLNKTVTEKFCLPEHFTRLVSLSDSANDMVMTEGSYSLHENLGQVTTYNMLYNSEATFGSCYEIK